jgi:hypothetical protein
MRREGTPSVSPASGANLNHGRVRRPKGDDASPAVGYLATPTCPWRSDELLGQLLGTTALLPGALTTSFAKPLETAALFFLRELKSFVQLKLHPVDQLEYCRGGARCIHLYSVEYPKIKAKTSLHVIMC